MSDEPETITLAFIGETLCRLVNDVGSLRDDMTVLTAIVQRWDGTVSGLVNEIRATHAQQSRLANRVRELEEKPS